MPPNPDRPVDVIALGLYNSFGWKFEPPRRAAVGSMRGETPMYTGPEGDSTAPDAPAPAGATAALVAALARSLLRLEDGADPGAAAGDARSLAGALAGSDPAVARLAAQLAEVTVELRDGRVGSAPELTDALLAAADALADPTDLDRVSRAADALRAAVARVPARATAAPASWPGPGGPVAADALAQFTAEALDSLHDAEAALLDLEAGAEPASVVNRVFRAVHSIKGTADFVGLAQLRALGHRLENVLERCRGARLAVTPDVTDLVFQGLDHLRSMVASLSPAGEADRDLTSFVASLDALGAGASGEPLEALSRELTALARDGSPGALDRVRAASAALPPEQAGELAAILDRLSVARTHLLSAMDAEAPDAPDAPPQPPAPRAAPREAGPPTAPAAAAAAAEPTAKASAKTMRVDQRKLDEYVNLAGELVIARNALVHAHRHFQSDRAGHAALKDAIDKVCRIAGDVQSNAMSMRMVPVGTVFQRFPRLVRDVAKALAKQIELRLEGEDTELDKQVAEALSDPLVHLVRNAADHGVEAPDRRAAAGKLAAGTITLRAGREGNTVLIDIQDDGGGIDPERVKAKAVAMGVVTAEQAAALTREQALQLIFAPGLSTAATVSDLSGRGVGMDVVKSNIAALGGAVTVHSELGAGTRVRLALPLTLAVTTVVLVESGDTLFGVPIDTVQETLKVEPGGFRHLRGVRAVALRGAITPVKPLAELVGLDASPEPTGDRVPVVVLNVGGERFGVTVDALRGQQEVVLKPVPPMFGRLEGIGGATILGDGGVVLVLDPVGLYQLALGGTGAVGACPVRAGP